MKTGVIRHNINNEIGFRIDPSFHLSEAIRLQSDIDFSPYQVVTISDVSDRIFLGNIFSRNFVADANHGVPYISASDTVLSDINTGKFISNKQASQLDYLFLKKGWILITCSGTLGNVTYTTADFEHHIGTHDLIRVVPSNRIILSGVVYAFLSSKYGFYQLTQSRFGGVVKHINDSQVGSVKIPVFPESFQRTIHALIQEASTLREEALASLSEAHRLLKDSAHLDDLTPEDYDYYGAHSASRNVSCFTRNISELGILSFHSFNYSERMRKTRNKIHQPYLRLYDVLDDSKLKNPTSVSVVPVKEGCGIMLINQSDIFDRQIKGKWVKKELRYTKDLLKYGEVLIAKIGTLGENETFCNSIFVNEDLVGQLTSSAFFRLKTNGRIPSGYLYAWLSCDYGFRLVRSTQYGTKQCYPNPSLLLNIPIPIVDEHIVDRIDFLVRDAHTKRHLANQKEHQAISMIEDEIESWNKNY